MFNNIKRLLREGLLSEKSISEFSIGDFDLKSIKDHWMMSNTETICDMFIYEMQNDYYLSDEEKEELLEMDGECDEIFESERFKKWVHYEVESKIENFINDIQDYFNNDGTITIWREMKVDQEWLDELPYRGKRIGIYWSYEENVAEAHWGGRQKHTIKMQTTVREEYIDWTQTIEANIDPDLGNELEITLFKNTPLKLEALTVDGKEIDVSNLQDKIFKA